jgi:hypothetical protein
MLTVGSNKRRMTSRRDVPTSVVTVLLLEKLHGSRTQCWRNVGWVCTMWKQTKAGVFVSGKGYPPFSFFIFVT